MNRNPINLINMHLPNLSKSEQKIGNYILNNYQLVTQLAIKELAKNIGVSQSSVIRFTQSLGYSGFREFKLATAFHASDNGKPHHFDDLVLEENSYEYIIKNYLQGNIANLEENLGELDYENLEEIAQLFVEKEHIFLVGIGYSGNLAQGAYIKLKSLLPNVHLATNHFDVVQDGYLLNEKSLVFAISQTGTSAIAIELAKKAQEVGTTTVALTASYNNPLDKISDYQIVPTASFRNTGSSYFATEIMFKIILDSLAVYVEAYLPDSNSPLADYL